MARKAYVGDTDGTPLLIPKGYIGGNDGKPIRLLKGYVGDKDGLARLFWGVLRTLTFTYDSVGSDGTIWASITLPDGRVIHHGNKIDSVEVSYGDTLRVFTLTSKYDIDAGVYVNGVKVMDTDKTGTYYDYTVTESATVEIDILQPGVNVHDPETGEVIGHSPAYRRGIVKITESGDLIF